MRAIFICGTDTGVGKTVVVGLLFKYLLEKGINVATQKWIQTGCSAYPLDVAQHLALALKSKKEIKNNLHLINPYCFKLPVSPHLASKIEGRRVDKKKIEKSLKALLKKNDFVVIEGIGGALVPLNGNTLVIDLVKKLKIPVLLVAANKLGCINHSLLTIEALRKRGIKIKGIIFNNMSKRQNKLIAKDNPMIVEKFSKIKVLGVLPYSKDVNKLPRHFKNIARRLQIKL